MSPQEKDSLLADIQQRFQYHPPLTEKRKQQHQKINESAAQFAEILLLIEDETARKQIMLLIQQARMLANQEVTVQEVYGDHTGN